MFAFSGRRHRRNVGPAVALRRRSPLVTDAAAAVVAARFEKLLFCTYTNVQKANGRGESYTNLRPDATRTMTADYIGDSHN